MGLRTLLLNTSRVIWSHPVELHEHGMMTHEGIER